MAMLEPLQAGQPTLTAQSKISTLLDVGLGAGQGSGLSTWGEAEARLDILAGQLGLPSFNDREQGGSVRSKINAMIPAMGLDADLDLYADFTTGRYWDNGPQVMAERVTDTWSGGLVETPTGYTSVAANVLARSALGLQTAPTRTNSIFPSNSFSAPWGKSAETSIADGAKLGLISTASLVTMSASFGYVSRQVGATAAGAVHTAWFIIEPGTLKTGYVQVGEISGANCARAFFNLNTGAITSTAVTGTGVLSGSGVIALGQGCYLVWVAGSIAGTASGTLLSNGTTGTGNWYLHHAQHELGSFATPPIVTTGAAVTRTGNRQVISGLDLQYGVAGFVEVDVKQPNVVGSFPTLLQFSDGSGGNRLQLYGGGAGLALNVSTGGASQAFLALGSWAQGRQVVAFAAGPNFALAQRLGDVRPTVDQAIDFPALDRMGLLGNGFSETANTYGSTKKLGLIYGTPDKPINQALFDQVYAMAEAA